MQSNEQPMKTIIKHYHEYKDMMDVVVRLRDDLEDGQETLAQALRLSRESKDYKRAQQYLRVHNAIVENAKELLKDIQDFLNKDDDYTLVLDNKDAE